MKVKVVLWVSLLLAFAAGCRLSGVPLEMRQGTSASVVGGLTRETQTMSTHASRTQVLTPTTTASLTPGAKPTPAVQAEAALPPVLTELSLGVPAGNGY